MSLSHCTLYYCNKPNCQVSSQSDKRWQSYAPKTGELNTSRLCPTHPTTYTMGDPIMSRLWHMYNDVNPSKWTSKVNITQENLMHKWIVGENLMPELFQLTYGKYKQMKGDNLSNQMIKIYNGYSSFTMPRSIWLHYIVIPQRRASFDPKDIIWTNLVEVH